MKSRIHRRSVLAFGLAALLMIGSLGQETPLLAAGTDDPGVPGPDAAGEHINAQQLPRVPRGDTPAQVKQIPRAYPVDNAAFGQLKAQANAAARARDHGLPGGTTTGPEPRFASLGMGDAGNWNPPDAALAVGAADILVAVNEAFSVYSRAGAPIMSATNLQSFFGTSQSTYDPRALYDAGRNRFVLLATTGAAYMLAVSETNDPTGAWCRYSLPSDRTRVTWADFPGLGMDGDRLYITSNQFRNGSNQFAYAQLLAIAKSSVYASTSGVCPRASSTLFTNLQNPGGGTAFTVQPANEPDAVSGQTVPMYFVNAIWSSGSNLVVRALSHTGSNLSLSAPQWVGSGSIGSYDLPADAPQPSGSGIATGDTRLLGAVYRFGSIYTGNTTMHVSSSLAPNPNPYANAQWYQIAPNSLTNSVGTTGVVTDPSTAYFFPGILPGCSVASGSACSTPVVALEVSGSGASQPASAFSVDGGAAPTLFAQGVAGYTQNGRWGDYPAMGADPTSTTRVWMLGEYASQSNAWGTAVTSVP